MKIGACALALAIGSYLFGIAGSKCLKENLLSISISTESMANDQKCVLDKFIEFIEFHSQVKQLSLSPLINSALLLITLNSKLNCTYYLQKSHRFFKHIPIYHHTTLCMESGHNLWCIVDDSNAIGNLGVIYHLICLVLD